MATLGGNIIVGAGGGDGHVKYADSEAIAAVEGEATLDLAGDVDVATGKTLSADGLKFPATQVASADGNTLDDYEEGTWTPTLMDNSLDGTGEGQGYTSQGGFYTKIGRRVYISAHFRTSSIGTLTTSESTRIGGLPFTSRTTALSHSAIAASAGAGLAFSAGNVIAPYIIPNTAYIFLENWDLTSGSSTLPISEWSADGQCFFGGSYEV